MPHLPAPIPLNERERELALNVAKHEAGHYIVGRVLGFRMTGITIQLTHSFLGMGHRGGAEMELHEETATLEDVLRFLERRVQVLYAGVLAEAMDVHTGVVDAKAAIGFLSNGAKGDYDKAREAIQLVRNIRHGRAESNDQVQSQLNEIDHELWNKAGDIVMSNRELVKGLSTRLAQMVKEVGPEYRLPDADLNNMKAIQDRFGASNP